MARHRATARGPSSRGSAVARRFADTRAWSDDGPAILARGTPTIRAALRIDCPPSARSPTTCLAVTRKRRWRRQPHPVDATLEGDIAQVEQSVADYLNEFHRRVPGAAPRSVGKARCADGPERRLRRIGDRFGRVGLCLEGRGAWRDRHRFGRRRGPECRVDRTVRPCEAAKEEVRGHSAATLAALRSASRALAEARDQGLPQG